MIKQYNKIYQMTEKQQDDNTLLQFLKKKSLFPPQVRSRSKSRISKDGQLQLHHIFVQQNLHQSHIPLFKNNIKQIKDQHSDNNMYYNTLQTQISQLLIKEKTTHSKDKNANFKLNNQYSDSKIWTPPLSPSRNNIQPHSSTPDKTKLNHIQLLKQKITIQLQKSKQKMHQYQSQLSTLLNIQIKKINKQLHIIFDKLYYQSQKYLKQYLKQKQKLICQQLIHINRLLYQQHQKLINLQSKIIKNNNNNHNNNNHNNNHNNNNHNNRVGTNVKINILSRPEQQFLIYNIQKHIQDLTARLNQIDLKLPYVNNVISLKLKEVQESIKYKFKI